MNVSRSDLRENVSRNLPPSLALNYLTLRRALGIIGICLPWGIIAFYLFDPGEKELRTSISAYYYSGMRDFFVGSLLTIGIFLVAYRGNHDRETKMATWAGFGAILVALCPTGRRCIEDGAAEVLFFAQNCKLTISHSVDYFLWPEWLFEPVSYVHYGAAGLFFVNVARLSYFVFTETSDTAEKLPEGRGRLSPEAKARRNRRYKTYGLVIAGCIVLMGADFLLNYIGFNTDPWKPVFWIEVVAVWTFATAWLEKGEALAAARNLLPTRDGSEPQKSV